MGKFSTKTFGYYFEKFGLTQKNQLNMPLRRQGLTYHMQIGENDRGALGAGSICSDGITNAIKKIGYDRWLVIETFRPWYEGVRACLWCQLAPAQNEIGGGELQFLRISFGSGV